jgi:hypothetical protein
MSMVINFLLENGAPGSVQTSCFTKSASHAAMGVYLNAASREKVYRFENHDCDLTIVFFQNDHAPMFDVAIRNWLWRLDEFC